MLYKIGNYHYLLSLLLSQAFNLIMETILSHANSELQVGYTLTEQSLSMKHHHDFIIWKLTLLYVQWIFSELKLWFTSERHRDIANLGLEGKEIALNTDNCYSMVINRNI